MAAATVSVGDVFYKAYVDTEEGEVSMQTYGVTTIRTEKGIAGGEGRQYVHLVERTKWNWKDGKYLASETEDYHRRKYLLAEFPQPGYAKSASAAYTAAIPEIEAAIKKLSKMVATLKGQSTRVKSAAAKRRRK